MKALQRFFRFVPLPFYLALAVICTLGLISTLAVLGDNSGIAESTAVPQPEHGLSPTPGPTPIPERVQLRNAAEQVAYRIGKIDAAMERLADARKAEVETMQKIKARLARLDAALAKPEPGIGGPKP